MLSYVLQQDRVAAMKRHHRLACRRLQSLQPYIFQTLTLLTGCTRRPWEVAAGSLPEDAAAAARRAAAADAVEENRRMAAAAAARRIAERAAEAERERRAISAEVPTYGLCRIFNLGCHKKV